MSRIHWRFLILALLFPVLTVALLVVMPRRAVPLHLAERAEQYDVTILRDTWGVPHVFGKSDADAAFGLAYAHAEDDFLTIQQSLLAARGRLASVYGADAGANDYMVGLLRIWDVVESRYDSDLSPETRALVEAYADGLNVYAARHPEQVLTPELFPLSGKDIVAGSVHKSPLFFGLDETLGELFKASRQKDISPSPTARQPRVETRFGSNTFAIGPTRTADGSTFFAVNSHQPWEGPVAWYEAHVHSEEGWNAVGGLFPGSPVIIHGHNDNLGWAFTVNHPDLVDVYVLDINPEDPYEYRFDGEWRRLEVREIPVRVRLWGRLSITVRQEALWSVYGPTVRRPHGTYAIRYAGMGRVDIFEQLYRMNKATDFNEWRQAMKEGGLASFNVGYADRDGNIYYLYNAMLPMRAEGYDWSLYLPGNTSATLWTEYLPFDRLPQVLNPPSGFIQNANSTPFRTTIGEGNPDPAAYSSTFGIDRLMSNRAWRALALFGADDSINFEEFKRYKFDMTYAEESDLVGFIRRLLAAPPPDDPLQRQGLDLLRHWDRRAAPDSREASLAILTWIYLAEENEGVRLSRQSEVEIDDEALWQAYGHAVRHLQEHFGRLDVPWSQVNRLQRGDLDLGLGGGPDLLHAIYGELQEDGRLRGDAGDSYVLLVRWLPDGTLRSYSIHQFGSATLDAGSPHYNDQSPLFARRQLKPVWFSEAEIRAHLEAEYRP
ncbi:MAG: acylase [Caldilineae bacterium]|nr:MAG: acylase [Caldilineae bacterium]